MDTREFKFLLGIFFANSASILLIIFVAWFYAYIIQHQALIWAGISGALLLMAAISRYFWRGLALKNSDLLAYSTLNILIALLWMWWLVG